MNQQLLGAGNAASRTCRLSATWAVVEARKTLPATIVVTGATVADDTDVIARRLAEAASIAGNRTALVCLSPGEEAGSEELPYAQLTLAAGGLNRAAFDIASPTWLVNFDAIIIDAGPFYAVALAAHLVRIADGVIVGLCDKRRVVPADHELAKFMDEVGAAVLGVVTAAPKRLLVQRSAKPYWSRMRPVTQQ